MKKVMTFCLIMVISAINIKGAPMTEANNLVIAENGTSEALIILPTTAKNNEKLAKSKSWGPHQKQELRSFITWQAGQDLAKYIKAMSGAEIKITNSKEDFVTALKEKSKPLFFLGNAAFQAEPSLRKELEKKAGKNYKLCPDAILVRRCGNRVYLTGLTPEATYHAVAWLLRHWGCRWYLPTKFGECIPKHNKLVIADIDFLYKPPFELRTYWISWNGSYQGYNLFRLRNFFTITVPGISAGHSLRNYTRDIEKKLGIKNHFNIPLTKPEIIDEVVRKVEKKFAAGEDVPLGMNDGTYSSDYPNDVKLAAGLYDKYFLKQDLTDVFMTFYNTVCRKLHQKYPASRAKVGFLAYNNITIPPQVVKHAHPNLYCLLAPIDIDPNHPMTSPLSPSRREYRAMLEEWVKVMNGRVVIYDYDQGMLVWRDLPDPSHFVFRDDMKIYQKAGIAGFRTESRNAIATVFTNLYFRGQLMWNPDLNVKKELAEFYRNFYGPAAKPMAEYWNAIYSAWENSIVTEHEYFAIPAIYTPDLVKKLGKYLADAENLLDNKTPAIYRERIKFTRLSYEIINNYTKMVKAAASECDYGQAYIFGQKALDARLELAKMNPTFTTRVWFRGKRHESTSSQAWLRGEVNMFKNYDELINGKKGVLLKKLPLSWAFKRDPYDSGLASNWPAKLADLTFWQKNKKRYPGFKRKDYPIYEWEMVRTDLYPQAQGVLHTDGQSYTGICYYQTTVNLSAAEAKEKVHFFTPQIFADSWLYINGILVAYRPQQPMWWQNGYKFQWDVDLSGKLKPGENIITIRCRNTCHVTGIFSRPLLYIAK